MFYHGDHKADVNPYSHPDPHQKRDAHGGAKRGVRAAAGERVWLSKAVGRGTGAGVV